MTLSELNPYIRHAHLVKITESSRFDEVVALDARLFFSLEGCGKITVKNKEYDMPENSLILLNSSIPYKIHSLPSSYAAINFDYTQSAQSVSTPVPPIPAKSFKKEMLLDYHTVSDAEELSKVLYIKEIPMVKKKLLSVINEHSQKLLYYEMKCSHIISECIAECMRFLKIESAYAEKSSANQILSYIQENFCKSSSNLSIGSALSYHPNYVSAVVKRLTGMSVHQYIIYARLTKAASLLDNTDLSCEQIAEECGFCDSAHFSKCFKKHFSISPSKYKNI